MASMSDRENASREREGKIKTSNDVQDAGNVVSMTQKVYTLEDPEFLSPFLALL